MNRGNYAFNLILIYRYNSFQVFDYLIFKHGSAKGKSEPMHTTDVVGAIKTQNAVYAKTYTLINKAYLDTSVPGSITYHALTEVRANQNKYGPKLPPVDTPLDND
jgi:hypothetical protein